MKTPLMTCYCARIVLAFCILVPVIAVGQESGDDQRSITITLVDDQGAPLPNTSLRKHCLYKTEDDDFPQIDNAPPQTDADGKVQIEVKGSPLQLMIHAEVEGFVPMYVNWRDEQFARGEVPEQLTIRLQKGTTIGGRVLDEEGKPVAGVLVEVRCQIEDAEKGDVRISRGLANEEDGSAPRTNENGEWSLHNAPGGKSKFFVNLKHPDFVGDPQVMANRAQPADSAALRDQTAKFEMQRGVRVSGKVTDVNGDPVASGFVIIGDYPMIAQTPSVFEIERDGTYRLPPWKPEKLRLTIVADGFAPQTRQIEIASMMEEPEFVLESGSAVTIQIVDENGERIAGAMVSIERWQNTRSIYNIPSRNPYVRDLGIPFRADDAGVFHWSNAPADPIRYQVVMMGYDPGEPIELAASDKPHVVKLKRSTKISGRVTDAKTKQPIDNFLVVPLRYSSHQGVDYPIEDRMNVTIGRRGKFRIDSGRQFRRSSEKHGFKIEAANYAPYFVDHDSLASNSVIELTPRPWPSIQVLDPDGNPVADCSVRIFSKTARLTINGYKSDDGTGRSLIKTDEQGKVLVPPSEDAFSVIAIDAAGYAEVELAPEDTDKKIQLQEWATLEGAVSDVVGETGDNRIIFEGTRIGYGSATIVQDLTFANIDENGKFRFDRLPPMLGHLRTLGRNAEREKFNRYGMPVKLEPGKTTVTKLGFGVTVSGSFELLEAEADHNLTHNVFRPIVPPKLPEGVAELNELDWRGGWAAYQELIKGEYRVRPFVYMHSVPTCMARVDDEGGFTINLPEAGQYDLAIYMYAKVSEEKGMISGPAGYLVKRFEVTEGDLAKGEMQLGKIQVPTIQAPNSGDPVGEIEFTAGDVTQTLSSLRSKYVLLDFWRPESEACRKLDGSLKELAGALGDQPFQLLSLTYKGPDSSTGRSSEEFENWTSAILADRSYDIVQDLGIWSMPRFVLVDPEGNFVLQGDFDSVLQKLREVFGK